MDEAERLADRVAIIDHGKLLVLDTPDALKRRVGEGDVLEIQLPGEPVDLHTIQPALEALGLEIDINASTLTLRALDAVNLLPSVMAGLTQAGIEPGEVRLRQNTLEDVFIQLTGRRLRA
jgi:ABC-2 type transport system ATP-binding protein